MKLETKFGDSSQPNSRMNMPNRSTRVRKLATLKLYTNQEMISNLRFFEIFANNLLLKSFGRI